MVQKELSTQLYNMLLGKLEFASFYKFLETKKYTKEEILESILAVYSEDKYCKLKWPEQFIGDLANNDIFLNKKFENQILMFLNNLSTLFGNHQAYLASIQVITKQQMDLINSLDSDNSVKEKLSRNSQIILQISNNKINSFNNQLNEKEQQIQKLKQEVNQLKNKNIFSFDSEGEKAKDFKFNFF